MARRGNTPEMRRRRVPLETVGRECTGRVRAFSSIESADTARMGTSAEESGSKMPTSATSRWAEPISNYFSGRAVCLRQPGPLSGWIDLNEEKFAIAIDQVNRSEGEFQPRAECYAAIPDGIRQRILLVRELVTLVQSPVPGSPIAIHQNLVGKNRGADDGDTKVRFGEKKFLSDQRSLVNAIVQELVGGYDAGVSKQRDVGLPKIHGIDGFQGYVGRNALAHFDDVVADYRFRYCKSTSSCN